MSELLVSIRVDALWLKHGRRVVGPPADVERLPWFDGQRDRNGSVPHVASAINAPPFGEHQGWLEPGVHLHWTLPDALTRGANRRDAVRTVPVDDLWFAPAPNRWVVALRLPQRDAAKIQRLWLIESDHVYPDDARPANAIAYPLPGAAPGGPPYVHVGRQIELDPQHVRPIDPSVVRGVPATSLASRGVTLTALGPGDPLFAAHYPSCRSVFGFHESVAAAEEGEPRHYTVLGWYRELDTDPLVRLKGWLDDDPQQALSLLARHVQGDGLALKLLPADPASLSADQRYQALKLALRERFAWAVDDTQLTAGEGLPETVMCLTSTTIVPGNEAAEAAPTDAGRAGIGSSDAEALAALLMEGHTLDAAQQDRLVQSLAATDLSHHTLDLAPKLAEARHTEQFHAERGHAVWVIRAAERHDTPGQPTEATLPDDLAHELNVLNLLQESFDRAHDRIAGLRQALFADWHHWMTAAYPEGDADPFAVDVDALRELIDRTRLQPLEALLQQAGKLFHGRTAAGGVVIAEQRAALPVDAPAPAGAMPGDTFFGQLFSEVVARGERLTGFDLWLSPKGAIVDVAVVGEASTFAPRLHSGTVQSVRLDDGEWVTALFGEVGQVVPHWGIGRLGFETNRQRRFGPWGMGVDAATAFRIEAPPGQAVVGLRGRQNTRHLLAIGIVGASPLHMAPLLPDAGNTLARQVVEQYRALQARLAEAAPAGRPFTLGVAPGPRFWRPNDPALVLDDPVAQASPRHGTDGRGAPDGMHPCLAVGVSGGRPSRDDAALWLWPSGPPTGLFVPGWMPWLGVAPFTTPAEAVSWHPIQLEWEVEVQPLVGASTVGTGRYPPDLVETSHTFPTAGADLEPRPGLPCATVGEYIAGRTMLNPAAGRLLQSRLPDVPADLPLDRALLAARAQPDAPPPMVLTLGGFHDQLLLRQREPQIGIADPIGLPAQRAFTARVRHAMGGLHPETPDEDGVFHPIRCGEMLIERLRVIDSFGRTQTWRPATLLKTARMQPADGAFDRARLPLRLTQAARLDFRWLSAAHADLQSNDHPATSPVCGWLVPDELDGTLEVYGREGHLLGSVDTTDAWVPAPGDALAPRSWREIDEPALQRVVRWLTAPAAGATPAAAVGDFVDLLDAALELIDPQDAARHPARAVLIGRPVAVVRARLALVLQQPPVPDPSMTALRARLAGAPDDDHGVAGVRLPVRLGELGQHNDGLCGYWIEDSAGFAGDVFHAPHGLDASTGNARLHVVGDAQIADFPIRLTPDGESTVVTMLVDPRGVVHAACGVLPVKSIAVPPDQYVEQLAAMRVAFPVAPVLTSADGVALPLPAEPGFAWSWIERVGDDWHELPHHPTVHRADLLAGFGSVGPALWDLLVAQGRIVQQRDPATGLLMPGARDVPASAFAALKLTPAEVERGLRSLARGIDEADTAARYRARAVVREGWLQLQPTPLPADGSGS